VPVTNLIAIALTVVALLFPIGARGQAQILDVNQGLPDLDSRAGTAVSPTSTQLSLVAGMGASASWNQFGTPQSLIKYGDFLATGLTGDPVSAALGWIRANKSLFRLSDQGVNNLELLNDSLLAGNAGHAVIFRQHFGNLPSAQDGLITVGIVNGNITYVSSSAAGDGNVPGAATLSGVDAWLKAAADVGRAVGPDSISGLVVKGTWTMFTVAGFSYPQRSRLVAFPTPMEGVRPAYETIVLDVRGGQATAYASFVDAQTGMVLFRQNRVQQLATTTAFSGTYTATACGTPNGPFAAPTGTKTIDVVATSSLPTNDIVLNLLFGSTVVASSDVLTTPEAIHYAPTGGVPVGNYSVQVCPFDTNQTPPLTYGGAITINDTVSTQPPLSNTPKWKFFTANPPLNLSSTDTRIIGCWLDSLTSLTPADQECQFALKNLASRAPWDFNLRTNVPNFTTTGNNAKSAEAWFSPLTPGPTGFQPADGNRRYVFSWTNTWQTSKCFQPFVTGVSHDISAATANLFAMHNRMHDWSYFLGFTEVNSNAQDSNFGNTDPSREHDPELGDAQAGAATGGQPSLLGRDNANQITLNDGIPPITNMYLWQPIAAAFYSPCVDGDYDMSVIGHEYTHLISNRMVAGPDANLTGYQAGSMGESWSDLDAVEYLNEYGFVPTNGENPFSVGAYVTGNKLKGIRNYGLNSGPLNYSDLGYDVPGPEVHSDGEIWNLVNFDIRQALVTKYNASFPASNAQLQRDCADGKLPANLCPGNRRWIQIVYDAWLLMPAAASMLDARDAYLAADMTRFGGANQTELWRIFARRGMGASASSNTNQDSDPTPSFESPKEANATITFNAVASNEGNAHVNAKIYVGQYEARGVPIADTDPATPRPNTAKFVPGTYDFVAQAPGYGMFRFTRSLLANQVATMIISMPTNLASNTKGATATASSTLSTSASDAPSNAIDDTENTDWSGTGQLGSPQSITVQFAGPKTIRQVNVSTMLRPGQNRFTALRQFRLDTSTDGVSFTPVFTSAPDAFPGAIPRPAAPDLILRSFTLPAAITATHLRLVALTNQCQGGPGFQGAQDSDPLNNSDCTTGNSTQGNRIRVTELQAFSSTGSASGGTGAGSGGGGTGCQDDDLRIIGPSIATPGSLLTYVVTYNTGDTGDTGCQIANDLPDDLSFVAATGGGTFTAAAHRIDWKLPSLPANSIGSVSFTVQVSPGAASGEVLTNKAYFAGFGLAPTTLLDTTVLLELP
jgi:hypothetical protein